MIGQRPAIVERRRQIDHWELGESSDCILTLVERKGGYVLMAKLAERAVAEANRALLAPWQRHPQRFLTITADNGTEWSEIACRRHPMGSVGGRWQCHGYEQIEAITALIFYSRLRITAGNVAPTKTPTA